MFNSFPLSLSTPALRTAAQQFSDSKYLRSKNAVDKASRSKEVWAQLEEEVRKRYRCGLALLYAIFVVTPENAHASVRHFWMHCSLRKTRW